jgi:hypothetical protein
MSVEGQIARLEERSVTTNEIVTRLETKFDALDEKLDKRFAAKWVQTVVSGIIAAVLLAFMAAITNHYISDKGTPVTSAHITNDTRTVPEPLYRLIRTL